MIGPRHHERVKQTMCTNSQLFLLKNSENLRIMMFSGGDRNKFIRLNFFQFQANF